jgi:tRNA G37 N-methylase TrmD
MHYKIFTLHPNIFQSFWQESLIARGLDQKVISKEMINWRDSYGLGNYKQVDDRPYGGGSGMVLRPEPIYEALKDNQSLGLLSTPENSQIDYLIPNFKFQKAYNTVTNKPRKLTIILSARGYPLKQNMAEWMAGSFDQINLVCGRYEGFDIRVSQHVDLELSLGQYVLNGGEVAAMTMVEAVSRLVPGFVTKDTSVLHDSFSSELNSYTEQTEYIIGKRKLEAMEQKQNTKTEAIEAEEGLLNIFNEDNYRKFILPKIEHPHFTRPDQWQGMKVPEVLLSGDHKKIQEWRHNLFKD